ncbi:hypothetical protein LTR97_003624 [Elasticomyces elasticus]|uniref:Uncharacterized protein n=1 Tax=Elasticomyces elasticus TaxID=574655 RepID=A0AAN8A3U4_9PEZI|nr:hypothetical protein LTR97_003624 [Elasticomyces elasticus]
MAESDVNQAQPLQERDPNTTSTPQEQPGANKKRARKACAKDEEDGSSKKQRVDASVPPPPIADISRIHLEGEDEEETPIFDTCDDIRKKMNEALANTTQVAFARTLSEAVPKSSVSTRQLAAFLKFKGPQNGAHSKTTTRPLLPRTLTLLCKGPAFYAGYVHFEKLRIAEGKKESAKRQKMRQLWVGPRDEKFQTWHSKGSPLGGFPRVGGHNARLTCPTGERWRLDQYGSVIIKGQATGGPIMRKKPARN